MSETPGHQYKGDHERLLAWQCEDFNSQIWLGCPVTIAIEGRPEMGGVTTSAAFISGVNAFVRVDAEIAIKEPVNIKFVRNRTL